MLKNFSWIIPNKLAGSGLPKVENDSTAGDFTALAEYGIKILVSLYRPSGDVKELCARSGMEWIYYPITDYGIPQDMAGFDSLVATVTRCIDDDRPVCVHCYAGVGRTGLVLACIVGKYYALSAQAAIGVIIRSRPAIETKEQEQFVNDYLAEYK